MDVEYKILNLYRTRQYEDCQNVLNSLETTDSRLLDFIRMRVTTILAKVAGDGYEEVVYGGQQDELTSTAIAKTPRPGTSFQRSVPQTSVTAMANKRATTTATLRNQTAVSSRARSARTALRTAARVSRAATAAASGAPLTHDTGVPLTLTLVNSADKLFSSSAKILFEYVFYCECDVRKALEIALQAQKLDNNPDWWWDFVKAKCFNVLGMHRSAEECLQQALNKSKRIPIYLRMVAMYVELNQPLSALNICKAGLSVFHNDTALNLELARIHEEMGNSALAVQDYRIVAMEDATNIEAIANIGMYNFYNDQPEIALRYYRRILATTSSDAGAEIYNNLGLCCFYCNQWDLILQCFKQALFFSTTPSTRAEIWFNLAHVALSTGDLNLARRCLQLALVMNSEHDASRDALRSLDKQIRTIK